MSRRQRRRQKSAAAAAVAAGPRALPVPPGNGLPAPALTELHHILFPPAGRGVERLSERATLGGLYSGTALPGRQHHRLAAHLRDGEDAAAMETGSRLAALGGHGGCRADWWLAAIQGDRRRFARCCRLHGWKTGHRGRNAPPRRSLQALIGWPRRPIALSSGNNSPEIAQQAQGRVCGLQTWLPARSGCFALS